MAIENLWLIGAGILRNLLGFFENAFKDGSVSAYEWQQLGATVLRVGVLGLAAVFGLGLDPVAAGGAALGADVVLGAWKKQ